MIRCFTGMPGSGKTYALVKMAYQAMRDGRPVYSNIAIKGTLKLTFEDMLTCSFPMGSVLIIDEAGRGFNSRKWKDLPDEIFDLFTLHRHLDLDMYIAAQNFGYIDSQLRRVIELTYWSRNIPFMPFHVYEGYYDLEKLGKMKDPDIRMFIRKSRKVRDLYNHKSMSVVYKDKKLIQDIGWINYEYEYKSRFKAFLQVLRIKYKRWNYKRKYQNKLIEKINDGYE